MEKEIKKNGYNLSRNWFDWTFENPEKVKPIHTAIYFYAVERSNRLGWKNKFGFPSYLAMETLGVKNWRTYSNGLNDLVDFGFIEIIEKSKNQHSANIISLKTGTVKTTKALSKAMQNHDKEQCSKQDQSIDSIYKPKTRKPKTRDKDLSPFELIKKEKPSELETWEMCNRKNVNDYDDLIEAFNNTAEMEILSDKKTLELDAAMLILRFKNYADSWIRNQKGSKVMKLEVLYDPDYVYFTTNANSSELKILSSKFEAYRANEELSGRTFTVTSPKKAPYAN